MLSLNWIKPTVILLTVADIELTLQQQFRGFGS
jgi:hypothetical protein